MTCKEFKIPDDRLDEFKDKIQSIESIGNDLIIILKESYATKDIWPIIEQFSKYVTGSVYCGIESEKGNLMIHSRGSQKLIGIK